MPTRQIIRGFSREPVSVLPNSITTIKLERCQELFRGQRLISFVHSDGCKITSVYVGATMAELPPAAREWPVPLLSCLDWPLPPCHPGLDLTVEVRNDTVESRQVHFAWEGVVGEDALRTQPLSSDDLCEVCGNPAMVVCSHTPLDGAPFPTTLRCNAHVLNLCEVCQRPSTSTMTGGQRLMAHCKEHTPLRPRHMRAVDRLLAREQNIVNQAMKGIDFSERAVASGMGAAEMLCPRVRSDFVPDQSTCAFCGQGLFRHPCARLRGSFTPTTVRCTCGHSPARHQDNTCAICFSRGKHRAAVAWILDAGIKSARCEDHRSSQAASDTRAAVIKTSISTEDQLRLVRSTARYATFKEVARVLDPAFRFFCGLAPYVADKSPELQREYLKHVDAVGKLLKNEKWNEQPPKRCHGCGTLFSGEIVRHKAPCGATCRVGCALGEGFSHDEKTHDPSWDGPETDGHYHGQCPNGCFKDCCKPAGNLCGPSCLQCFGCRMCGHIHPVGERCR